MLKKLLVTLLFLMVVLSSLNQAHGQTAMAVNEGFPNSFRVNRFLASNGLLFANVGPCQAADCKGAAGTCPEDDAQSGLYVFQSEDNRWELAIPKSHGAFPKYSLSSVNGSGDLYQILGEGDLRRLGQNSAGEWSWSTVINIKDQIFPGHAANFNISASVLIANTDRIYGYNYLPAKQGSPEHYVIWIYELASGNLQHIIDEGIKREFGDGPRSMAVTQDGIIYTSYDYYARERAEALYDEPLSGTDERLQGNIFRFIPEQPWDYSSGEWQTGHRGIDQGNLTNGNCCGRGRDIHLSDDRETLYHATQQANYRYNPDFALWELLSEEDNQIYEERQGKVFSTGGSQKLTLVDGGVRIGLGDQQWADCVGDVNAYQFIPGTNRQELLVFTTGNCEGSDGPCPEQYRGNTVWRMALSDEGNSVQVSNIHPTTLTYLGGEKADNVGVGLAITQAQGQDAPKLYVGGNFDITGQENLVSVAGASPNAQGCVLQMDLSGQVIEQVLQFGDTVYDFDMNTSGQGVVAYQKNGIHYVARFDAMLPGAASTFEIPVEEDAEQSFKVSIAESGEVGVLAHKNLHHISTEGVVSQTSLETNKPITIFPTFVKDVAISSDHGQVYVTGFDNKECEGTPVQVAFVIAYDLNLSYRWHTYGFNGEDMCGESGNDMADTRGYLLDIGDDGQLYFAGESAGGNTAFRWDGTYTDVTGTDKQTTLVEIDQYTQAINTKSNHISYMALMDHTTGIVKQGQLILSRLSGLEGNTYRVRDGSLFVDATGNTYLGGNSAAFFGGRESIRLGGKLLGEYGGGPNGVNSGAYKGGNTSFGDAVLYGVNSSFNSRSLWLGFTRNEGENRYAGGTVIGIASAYGTTAILTVGSGHYWTTENALAPEPFSPFDGKHNDTYLGVWSTDIAANANNDELEPQLVDGGFVTSLPDDEPLSADAIPDSDSDSDLDLDSNLDSDNPATPIDLVMYPNPMDGETLAISSPEAILYIGIYDLMGQLLFEQQGLDSELVTLELHQLQSAVYLVQIGTQKGIYTKKLIKR